MPNLLQITLAQQAALSAGMIKALIDNSPLLAALSARSASGTKFTSLALTANPSANPFVDLNEGFTTSEAAMELREFNLSLVGGQVKAERITAALWNRENGQRVGYDWLDLQLMTKLRAQGIEQEKQIIKGTVYDAKGYPGLKQLLPFTSGNVMTAAETPAKYNFARSVINAAGTTSNTASSVYAVIEGEMDVQMVIGTDGGTPGEMFTVSELVQSNEAPNPAEPTKLSLHDVQQFWGYVGLSLCGFNQTAGSVVPRQYSARRIANLTGDSGKGLTDALMSKLSRSFGPGRTPTMFIAGSRSGEQLGASRQATAINYVMGQTGDAANATYNTYPEPPDNWRGIPIIYADNAIGEDEAVEA